MSAGEVGAIRAAAPAVKNADQIDRCVAARNERRKLGVVMDVGFDDVHGRQWHQRPGADQAAGWRRHPHATLGQPGDDRAADESGCAEHENAIEGHGEACG